VLIIRVKKIFYDVPFCTIHPLQTTNRQTTTTDRRYIVP